MSSIGRLINVMFASRDAAHRAHLTTTSYAQHMALGEFYEGVVERADAIAEAWQGRNGAIKSFPEADIPQRGAIDDVLEDHLDWIEVYRYEAIDKNDTPLQNLVDEACDLYLSTLYKLRRFK